MNIYGNFCLVRQNSADSFQSRVPDYLSVADDD